MTTETEAKTVETNTFDRTVAELKHGVANATQAQAEVSEKAVKAAKDFAAFNKASLEAFTNSGKILVSGSMELYSQVAKSNEAVLTETLSGYRALMAAKSAKEGIELQASLTRAAAARAVSESTRLAQATLALAEKVAAPLTAHAAYTAETYASLKV